jgi:Transposase DDE domain
MSKRKSRNCRKRKASGVVQSKTHADLLRQALQWFGSNDSFSELVRHGNVNWSPLQLVALVVLWSWSDRSALTAAFADARDLSLKMFGGVAVRSYQGMMGALRSYTASLLPLFWRQLHARMEQVAGQHWRIGWWLALAVDGSRLTTPRTVKNERAFAIRNYGHGKKAKTRKKWKNKKRRSKKISEPVKPQIWLTLLWHMGLKSPWSWRTGPSTASERAHLLEMIETQEFPENTLFCGDAGFVGYDFWNTIHLRGHHFLVRVGANVRLLKRLGTVRQQGNRVYLWPDKVAHRGEPPLELRLIQFQGARAPVFLVTNVLSESELSQRQAAQLYRLRWGVELQFRALKQTFGRTKLRSRTPENAIVELHWSVAGLTLVQLFAIKEQIKIESPPARSSVALALAAIREAVRHWSREVHEPRAFIRRLQEATKDEYTRHGAKRARYQPKFKDEPCATAPIIKVATAKQRRAYRALQVAT